MLPPPLDAYCSDSASAKPIVKVPSTVSSFTSQLSRDVQLGLSHVFQEYVFLTYEQIDYTTHYYFL